MDKLGIEFYLVGDSDQLDTIEERSDEGTPQFELVRQYAREWSRRISDEIASLPEDENEIKKSTDEIKISFNQINEELLAPRPSSKSILKKILKLQEEMVQLRNILEENKGMIANTEQENCKLLKKIEELENLANNREQPSSMSQKCIIA